MKPLTHTSHHLPRHNEQQIRRILRVIEKILKQDEERS